VVDLEEEPGWPLLLLWVGGWTRYAVWDGGFCLPYPLVGFGTFRELACYFASADNS
jgi:hypothetical protein